MSAIYGVLGVADTERAFLSNIGQAVVFDAINEVLAMHNEDVAAAISVFVRGDTEKFQERHLSPGDGLMSPASERAPGPAVQRSGYWDVAYPLRGWEESVAGSRVGLAYMTVEELDAHLDTIVERNIARHRQRILIALFEDTNLTWTDKIHGALTIRRLANTDGALYPALPGATAEAQDDHYLAAGYLVTAIADANNPVATLRDEIIEHFGGRSSGGESVLVLHNADATDYLEDLTDYDAVPDFGKIYGADTDQAKLLESVPGRMHGRTNGCWVSEWAWIPATYMVGVHLTYPPLKRRVDPADTGLPRGLTLVAEHNDHPLKASYFADRFGYAAFNRLSAAVITMVTGGYTPPSDYAE